MREITKEEWINLSVGDLIYSKKSLKPRRITNQWGISSKELDNNAVYSTGDRKHFYLKHKLDKEVSNDV